MIYDREGLDRRLCAALDLISKFPYFLGRTAAYEKILYKLYCQFDAWWRSFPNDNALGVEYNSLEDPNRPYVIGTRLVEAIEKYATPPFNNLGSVNEAQSRLNTLIFYKTHLEYKPSLIEHIEYAEFLMKIFWKLVNLLRSNWALEEKIEKRDQTSQAFMSSIDINLVIIYLFDKGRLSYHEGAYCLNIKKDCTHPSGLSYREISNAISCLLPDWITRPKVGDYFKRYIETGENTGHVDAIPINTSKSIGYQKGENVSRGITASEIIEEAEKLRRKLYILSF